MNIKEYIKKYYPNKEIKYNHDITIITDNDKDVIPNSVFVAKKGYTYDGITFIKNAIDAGAKTIIYNNSYLVKKEPGINYLDVNNSVVELARLINLELCDKHQVFIGVSGTCGKTTVTYLVYSFLKSHNYDVLLVGTHHIYRYYGLKEEIIDTINTTVTQTILYKELKNRDYNYDFVIMEVSSQGIAEGRVLGIEFDTIAITNLSNEHLDYHHTFSEYKITKGSLLNYLNVNSQYKNIILNIDDDSFNYFSGLSLSQVTTFGIKHGDIMATNVKLGFNKTLFDIFDNNSKYVVDTNLMGEFNVYNILTSYCILKSLNFSPVEIANFFNKKIDIPGRMNVYIKNHRYLIIDYAHTVNAVSSVLSFINSVKENKKVTTIIGVGGNRDHTKRPLIGGLATKFSDYVFFTTDNPRDEDPYSIIQDMVKGVKTNNFEVIVDREEAIKKAYATSQDNEIILILGKGTEKVTILANGIEVPYSDIQVVNKLE